MGGVPSPQGGEGPSSFPFPSLLSWEGSARAVQWEGNSHLEEHISIQCSEAGL